MDTITQIFMKLDVTQIVAIVILGWIFYNRICSKIDKLDVKMEKIAENVQKDIQLQSTRSDRLYEMFIDLLKDKKTPKTDP